MSKKNFNKSGKEKLAMFLTSALVVGACTLTGLYVNKMEKIEEDGYVVDLSELDNETQDSSMLSMEEMSENDTGSVNSDSVVNELADLTSESEKTPVEKKTEIPGVGYLEDLEATEKAADIVQDSASDKITDQLSVGSASAINAESSSADTVLQFGIDDKMMWPMSGDVILNYSMDKTIYFPTLDQYKYNPAIYISGEVGAQISSAARGRVESIGTNEEIGQFITMDFGDGYQVTYGQLQDLTVEEGDIVAKGQVIASLASPTKYNSLEGANLYFAVTKDGTSINPMEYLQ